MKPLLLDNPLHFEALDEKPTGVWSRPRHFGFLDRIGGIPVSDSELLQSALYLPLAVREEAGTCEVVAVVHTDFLARPLIRDDGRWLPFYMPIALRCLPFRHAGRAGGGGAARLEIATGLDVGDGAAVLPFIAEAGRPHRDFATAMSHLDRLEIGKARLAKAAAALLAADLLVKLTSSNARKALDTHLLVVDPSRLRRLTPARTMALAIDGFLTLDLATACCFSSRLWASHLTPESRDTTPDAGDPVLFDHRSHGVLPVDLRIDDSSLFSFEAFTEGDDQ